MMNNQTIHERLDAYTKEKYDLHMTVERFVSANVNAADDRYIRR